MTNKKRIKLLEEKIVELKGSVSELNKFRENFIQKEKGNETMLNEITFGHPSGKTETRIYYSYITDDYKKVEGQFSIPTKGYSKVYEDENRKRVVIVECEDAKRYFKMGEDNAVEITDIIDN